MSNMRTTEIALTIIVIILSGSSVSFMILGTSSLVPFIAYRNFALIPSIVIIFAIGIASRLRFQRLTSRLFVGMAAGAIATLPLEAIRIPGYAVLHWLPGDDMIMMPGMFLTGMAPNLMGLMNMMHVSGAMQPPLVVFVAGALWHFWNGATMGLVYSLWIGKGRWWYGLIWGFVINIGMMLAPWLIMMMGPFGIKYMQGYNIFVIALAAHLAFGAVLGILIQKWKKGEQPIFTRTRLNQYAK